MDDFEVAWSHALKFAFSQYTYTQLVFNELSSEAPKTVWSENLLDCATDCVIQLLKVSQKKKGPTFQPLKSFIFLQVDSLAACVQKINDPEIGE